jgi:hypothetical protein
VELVEAVRRLQAVLGQAPVIGGIGAAIHGVERFTRDIDLTSSLSRQQIEAILQAANISFSVRLGNIHDSLPWVVHGDYDGIPFQILPADAIGVQPDQAVLHAGVLAVNIHDFIRSKCLAGGQQDMHDVAALAMLNPDLREFIIEQADRHGCLDKLESWLSDERLRARFLPDA